MTISQQKYVEITSGVGGAASVTARALVLRLFTSAAKAPADQEIIFKSSAEVAAFFGGSSDEAKIASKYFGYVSNYQTSPSSLSFFADSTSGKAPFIWANKAPAPLANLKAVTTGSFALSMGGISAEITGLNFASAASYADVASAIQTAIRAADSTTLWTSATCQFANGSFVITGGEIGANAIVALSAASTGTAIATLLGLDETQSPVVSQGVNASTHSELLSKALNISNNYATFAFIGSTLSNEQIVEIAQWTHTQNEYGGMYIQRVAETNVSALQPLVAEFDGVCLVADAFAEDSYAWLIPAAVAASTNYNRINGTQNFMYKQMAGVTPSITTDTDYEALTSVGVNFYGATQQAGKNISFFQPGYLQGSIKDCGVYVNEIWLKDACTTEFLNYQLAVAKWPQNASGKAIGDGLIQGICEIAKNNGTISQAKELTSTQKAYITSITGNDNAWRDVYAEGYYLISSVGNETYTYTLIYSKGDSIRKVEGTHSLI